MRQVTGLVAHGPAVADVQAEIEVAQVPAAAQRDLLEDRVGAQAERGATRIVEAVHGGQRVGGAIGDRDADQRAVAVVAQLDRVGAALDEKLLVALLVDQTVADQQPALDLVSFVERRLFGADHRRPDLRLQPRLAAAEDAALRRARPKFLDVDADRLAGAAGRAAGPVEQQALTSIAGCQALRELLRTQTPQRQAQW